MSIDFSFSKEKLDECLKELGKEFRKLGKKRAYAEIILVGGASVAINYNFRDMTTDVDAVIKAASLMKDAIIRVGDKYKLPSRWLNDDFKETTSYSEKLREVSEPYKTFSNVVEVRTISGKYLIAMKAMSGRQYKFDTSDIVGVLLEHKKQGKPISREDINKAAEELYGHKPLPKTSVQFLDDVFSHENYEYLYAELREIEKENKEFLLEFEQEYPETLSESNINVIIEKARHKKESIESGEQNGHSK